MASKLAKIEWSSVAGGNAEGRVVLTADGKREDWSVEGSFFAGRDCYHVKGSPVDPNRLDCSQSSAWFGQLMERSDDGGKTWRTPAGFGSRFAIKEP